MLLLPRRAGRGRRGRSGAGKRPDQARAVHADVRELVEVRDGSVQRLAAAHRQARDRAMRLVRVYAIVRFRIRHHVVEEVLDELVGRAAAAAHRPLGVPGRHDDDHRLRLLRRDQVIQNEARAPHRRPCVVVIAGAVQEIKNGVLRRAYVSYPGGV